MLRIDTHSHLLPRTLPDFAARTGDRRWPVLHGVDDGVEIHRDGRFFRKVDARAYDPAVRRREYLAHGVDVQVVCTVPVLFCYWAEPSLGLAWSQHLNDELAAGCQADACHYVGLATLPLQAPELAAQELRRAVRELGLRGMQIGSHHGALNLGDPELDPLWAAARELDAAILIHPWEMMGQETMGKYWLPWLVGMPAEQARAYCSIVFGGVLDRFPGLKLAFAHGGGAVPWTIGRIEHGWRMRPDLVQIDSARSPRSALTEVIFDSCVHDPTALRYLIELMGADRLMLGTDYPFPLGEQRPGQVIDQATTDSGIREQIYSGTALRWLGMSAADFAAGADER